MESGGDCGGVVGVLSGAVWVGETDWTKAWGGCSWYAGFRTEEYGVCDLDGIYVFEPCDSIGWRVLFGVA